MAMQLLVIKSSLIYTYKFNVRDSFHKIQILLVRCIILFWYLGVLSSRRVLNQKNEYLPVLKIYF